MEDNNGCFNTIGRVCVIILIAAYILVNFAGCLGFGPMKRDGFVAEPPYRATHYGV